MSGVGQTFKLAGQGQDMAGNLDLMGTHINIPATINLIERAFHDDKLDKLVERAEMLVVLAKKHRAEHQKMGD